MTLLLEYEDYLPVRAGAWFPGEKTIYRGLDLHKDLKDADWMELHLYGATGRRFTNDERSLLNAIWTYTSYPDPRLWNNRVSALAGSSRSSGVLGVSAAMAISEAEIYGRKPGLRSIEFFIRALDKLKGGQELEELVNIELKQRRILSGYGRPIQRRDERIGPIMQKAESVGLHDGGHIRLAFSVEAILQKRKEQLKLNYGGVIAALCADLGFTPRQYYLWMIPAFIAGMVPCYQEAIEKPEGSFLPLRCSRISYEGPSRRTWERG